MRTKVISASSISEAAGQILAELKDEAAGTATRSSRPSNVIYFDGWNGLGASAVLREVGRLLTPAASVTEEKPALPIWERAPPPLLPPPAAAAAAAAIAASLKFSQIFHIDSSKWESRRAMQRAIVEQLQLPAPVIQMLDAQDEEDDYKGKGRESRAEIPQVAEAIYQHIQKLTMNRKFLVIFHNRSNEEIDLDSFGFPLSGYSGSKVLWSFQGRFRLYPRTKVDRALESTRTRTDVRVSANWPHDNLSNTLLRAEAADVLLSRGMGSFHNYSDWWDACDQVTQCFHYMMKLSRMCSGFVDYDLITHGCNCWKCDSSEQLQLQHLLQHQDVGTDDGSGGGGDEGDGDNDDDGGGDNDDGGDGVDRLWLSCDSLYREIRLDEDYYQNPYLPSVDLELLGLSGIPYWTSPTYGFMLIPELQGCIPKGMFQQFDKLCVLKLSACAFSFTSPPFLCCHSLRFLWLDHCKEWRTEDTEGDDDDEGVDDDVRRCLRKLWVLDVRYSSSRFLSAKMMDFMTQLRELNVMGQEFPYMDGDLQGRLYNVRKLRVTKCIGFLDEKGFVGLILEGKDKMEHLELSGNDTIGMLYVDSSCSSLETAIIDGSTYLENISFKGCAKLKNLLLRGLFPLLYSLDITGTAVKILDLRAVEAPKLDELILLGCGKLYAILWPPEDKRKRYLGKLRMDTTQQECSDTTTGTAAIKGGSPVEFDWYISVRDTKILGSLAPVKDYFSLNDAHVVISTTPSAADAAGGNKGITSRSRQGNLQQHNDSSIYADVTTNFKDTSMHQQASDGDDYDARAFMCTCPPPPHPAPYPEPPFPPSIPPPYLEPSFPPPPYLEPSFPSSSAHPIPPLYPEPSSPPSSAHPIPPPYPELSFPPSSAHPIPPPYPKWHIMSHDCYMHIEDEMMRTTLQTASGITVPGFICDGTKALHVHDSLSISSISATPLGSRWNKLEWCRVERCPKLECVFREELFGEGTSSDADAFNRLRTIWASRLPNARYIMQIGAFKDLTLLHLYCCPRLAYACPLTDVPRLETLEIMWCGDLTVLFNTILFPPPPPLPPPPRRRRRRRRRPPPLPFPYLKHIHLHELPKLHDICRDLTMFTPSLETLKIRGCWSLTTLPIVDANNAVECDCEKEWWDRLQWGSRVQPGHYKPTHSRYYKKRMLRGSPLR